MESVSPTLDRTGLFTCISTVIVCFVVLVLFVSLMKKKTKHSLKWKLFLFLSAGMLLYFALFTMREIKTTCGFCCIEYSHYEMRLCGKLIASYNYETYCFPEHLLERPLRNKNTCFHCYVKDTSVRYWGGLIPTYEYERGIDGLDTRFRKDHPYKIDERYKITRKIDENENIYYKVTIPE
jgi:hypothetical protein